MRRERNAVDARMLDITLTDRGIELRTQAEVIPPRVAAAVNLPIDELETLRDALHRVIAATAG